MGISVASVVAGSEHEIGEGVSGAVRCVIRLEDGSLRGAVLKRVSRQEVEAEYLAAKLLMAWGLAVPEPFLVMEGSSAYFASADVGYPNLKKRFGFESTADARVKAEVIAKMSKIVCSFASLPRAIVCDEVLKNTDRNLGNILWDGNQEWWIDHARTFDVTDSNDVNKLCDIVVSQGNYEPIQRSAVTQGLLLDRSVPAATLLDPEICPQDFSTKESLTFVDKRLAEIASLVLARFPKPADLLHGL
jgi:hypothetical protein